MRFQEPLAENLGEDIEDYVQRATCSLEWTTFRSELCAYLQDQDFEIDMDHKAIKTLFDITVETLKERSASSSMKKARLEQDWKAQRMFTGRAKKRLLQFSQALEIKSSVTVNRNTLLLAGAFERKINTLLRELEDVAEIQRARKLRLSIFMRSARNEKSHMAELDRYLQHRIPRMSQEQRHKVIGGTMIASGLKSDRTSKDYAANIPMAISRANRELGDEGPFVKWLDKAPLRKTGRRFFPVRSREKEKTS